MPDVLETKTSSVAISTAVHPEIVVGKLVGVDESGIPHVDWPQNPQQRAMPALSTAIFTHADNGRSVALLFANGDSGRPVIVGLIRQPLDEVVKATEDQGCREEDGARVAAPDVTQGGVAGLSVTVDGERVVVSAEREIVLRCGKASITLTRSGKVLIRGDYVQSRSAGVNRIKGGSVLVN